MLSWFAIRQHLALQTGFDLGVYTQVLWTTAHGQPFYQSLMEGTTNFLTLHFVPLLAVLAPIYAIWPDARTLLILQSILLAAAALPLWAFARPRLGPTVAFLLALAYSLSPLLHFVALADFHEIALAVPLLMAAGAALLDKRPRATFIWLGLALLVKEELALVALGFGLYALFIQRRWRFGAALLAFGVAWAILLATVLMPTLLSNGGGSNFARHYGALGGTPGQILRMLVTDPLAATRVILTPDKLRFLWQLVAPLALLPIVGLPVSLLMLPSLAYLLLGGDGFLTST